MSASPIPSDPPSVLADPAEAGVDPSALDALRQRARREIDDGLLPSCQLAVARHGRLVAFDTFGAADPDGRYLMFSCTKAVTGGVAWLLLGDGRLREDETVGELVPRLADSAIAPVTVAQLLTHTSGFPTAPLGPPAWFTHDERIGRMARWRLNWEPGTRFEYHPTAAHWVIAAILHELTGLDHRVLIQELLLSPLGLERMQVGVNRGDAGDVRPLVTVGEPATPEEFETALGIPGIEVGDVTDEALESLSSPDSIEVGVPGGCGVTTAADLALYYHALLHNPHGLWDADVLADATGRIRTTMPDPMTGTPSNRSLGLIIAGDDGKAHMRGFGHGMSPRTFGHNGAAGQVAWADPDTGLSFAYLTDGNDRHLLRQARRGVGLSSRAAALVTND
ncbi:serine hydrolase domain-containing protein [soil metagenome]